MFLFSCIEGSQSLWWDVGHKSIHGSVVTPLSCKKSLTSILGAAIICPQPKTHIISMSGKKHPFQMFCSSFCKQAALNWYRSAYMHFLKQRLPASLWNTIWCRQYRRFNLWYSCHQIMWRASLQRHYISESCLHSLENENFEVFFCCCTFWSSLVLTQFGCNVLASSHTHLPICISLTFFAKLRAFCNDWVRIYWRNRQTIDL